MRDVSPGNKTVDLQKLIRYLIEFVKNPIQGISILPDWNWPSVLTIQILLALASGVLAGLLKLNIYRLLYGLFLMPIVTTVSALLLTLFLYYYFQFFENRTESYRKLFILIILSSIPFYLFQIISEYFAPITLIGFSFTTLLAIVGLCENFKVERKRAYIISGTLFLLVLVAWITNRN
ncbi:MAG: YIP1 family protein [Pseudobdellovibrio sp.]